MTNERSGLDLTLKLCCSAVGLLVLKVPVKKKKELQNWGWELIRQSHRGKRFAAHHSPTKHVTVWRGDGRASSCITGRTWRGGRRGLLSGPILKQRRHWSELLFINHALKTRVCVAFILPSAPSRSHFYHCCNCGALCLCRARHWCRYNGAPFIQRDAKAVTYSKVCALKRTHKAYSSRIR